MSGDVPRPPPAVTETIKARKESPLVQFSDKIGKTEVIDKGIKGGNDGGRGISSNSHGFHCSTCKASFTSSDAFLDHCNGRVHQKNLGLSMKVERVDQVERVKARLQELAQKRHTADRIVESKSNRHFVTKLEEAQEDFDLLKEERKKRKKQKKNNLDAEGQKNKNSDEDSQTDDNMALMGFKSFS